MNEERPFLQIPIPFPSDEEARLFKEWSEKKEKEDEENKDGSVIIIDI